MIGLALAAALAAAYEPPPYANPEAYAEEGAFFVPKGKGPFPAVVLVGESDPLLRDLAAGLASRGVLAARAHEREAALKDLRQRADVDRRRIFLVRRGAGTVKGPDLAGSVTLAEAGGKLTASFRGRGPDRRKVYDARRAGWDLVGDLFNWIFKGRL